MCFVPFGIAVTLDSSIMKKKIGAGKSSKYSLVLCKEEKVNIRKKYNLVFKFVLPKDLLVMIIRQVDFSSHENTLRLETGNVKYTQPHVFTKISILRLNQLDISLHVALIILITPKT